MSRLAVTLLADTSVARSTTLHIPLAFDTFQVPLGSGDICVSLLLGYSTEDDVHLFERLALGLGEEEDEDATTEDVDGGESDEELPSEGGDHGRGDLGEREV